MSVPINVNGVNGSYNFDYTSTSTSTIFNTYFNQLQTLGNSTKTLTSSDLAAYNAAMSNLTVMLQGNGVNPDGTTTALNAPLTAAQAHGIGTLIQFSSSLNPNSSFSATNPSSPALTTLAQLNQWRDLYVSGFSSNVSGIQAASAGATTSLQSMIELDYVSNGNSLIYNQLNSLGQAITATNNAMQVLNSLQLVMDRAAVQTRATVNNIISSPLLGFLLKSVDSVPGLYATHTSALGEPLSITVDSSFASSLMTQGATLISDLKNAIQALIPFEAASSSGSPPTLSQQLQTILDDIQQGPPGVTNPTVQQQVAWWLLDNNNASSVNLTIAGNPPFTLTNFQPQNAGNFQNDLQNAMNAAQSQNAQQNINLKQTIFVFQEFYQSASSALTTLNDINKAAASQEAS